MFCQCFVLFFFMASICILVSLTKAVVKLLSLRIKELPWQQRLAKAPVEDAELQPIQAVGVRRKTRRRWRRRRP